jgi:ParB family chromosome partitioning protein
MVCQNIIDNQLSVRATENVLRIMVETVKERADARSKAALGVKPKGEPADDPNERAAVAELEAALGTKVRLSRNSKGGGRVEIEFYSADDLDRIYSVIVRP